jgi:hypothetical protein
MLPTKRIETHNRSFIASHLNQHTKFKPKPKGSNLSWPRHAWYNGKNKSPWKWWVGVATSIQVGFKLSSLNLSIIHNLGKKLYIVSKSPLLLPIVKTTPFGANWNAGCPQNLPWFVLKTPKDSIFNESQLKVALVFSYLLAF